MIYTFCNLGVWLARMCYITHYCDIICNNIQHSKTQIPFQQFQDSSYLIPPFYVELRHTTWEIICPLFMWKPISRILTIMLDYQCQYLLFIIIILYYNLIGSNKYIALVRHISGSHLCCYKVQLALLTGWYWIYIWIYCIYLL